MIILFIFYLFVHLNLIKCNEIKNWTTNDENKIVVTQRYIRNDSHAIYQPTSNRRGKRANTPPRRSRSRSPLRTPGPNDQQRTPPLQLQPGNPFGVQQFPPARPIAGQPFMPQPIVLQPTAPIGPVGQMLPPIGGGQPIGQMPMNIMPAAFGPSQQPQYMQHQQPSLQPQNIPQHRSPIAPRPASPIYELQSLYERPQVHSPQHYHNLSPTQRAIFEDIQQDVQIRNAQNPHQDIQQPNARMPQIRAPEIAEGQHIRIRPEQQAQFDELYQATNVGYRRAVQRHLDALRRGDTTRQYDENLIAGFRGLHVYGRVPLNHFTTYGFQPDNLKREFIARGIPVHPTYRGRPAPPQNNEFNMAMALSDLEAHLWRRHSVGSPSPPENFQQQAPLQIPQQQKHAGFIDPVFLRQQIPPRGNIADAIHHPPPNVPQRRIRSRSRSPHSPGNRATGPPPKKGRNRSPPKGFGGRKKRNAKFA